MTETVDINDVDQAVYQDRAGTRHEPAGYSPVAQLERLPVGGGQTAFTFWSDVAEFQPTYDASYPWAIGAFRIDNGGRLDYKASANWNGYLRGALHSGRMRAVLGYVVFKPGALSGVLARVRSLIGTTPPPQFCIEIDMESGAQFAGPGNHSAEANHWAAAFADYCGSWKRVVPYANAYDYRTNWPQMDPRLTNKITASYGSLDPGSWGQQFYGGQNYPVPAGFPRAVSPFGAWVDLNAARRSVPQVLADLGIGAPPAPSPATGKAVHMFMAQSDKSRGGNGGIGMVGDDLHMKPITNVADVGNYHTRGGINLVPVSGAEFATYPRLGGNPITVRFAGDSKPVAVDNDPDFPDLSGPELDALMASWNEA